MPMVGRAAFLRQLYCLVMTFTDIYQYQVLREKHPRYLFGFLI